MATNVILCADLGPGQPPQVEVDRRQEQTQYQGSEVDDRLLGLRGGGISESRID